VVKREFGDRGLLRRGQYFIMLCIELPQEEKNTEEVLKWHNQRGRRRTSIRSSRSVGDGADALRQSYANAVSLGLESLLIISLLDSNAFVSRVMGETYDCNVSLEDGAGGGSDCKTRWRDGFKVMIDLEKWNCLKGSEGSALS